MNGFIHRQFQLGFSVVELMVAMLLGLFLVLGVAQVYLGSKRTYNTQEGMSRLQENGRIGMFFLQRSARLAGYYSDPLSDPLTIFTQATPAIQGTEGGANPDTITIRYQGNVDCLGNPVAANTTVTNTFSLTAADAATGLRSLQCNAGAGNQPLIEGISDMQITYGIDTTLNDTNSTANRYVTATGVGANGWANVRSVRIILTANSVTQIDTGAGLRLQPFATTIALRNRM